MRNQMKIALRLLLILAGTLSVISCTSLPPAPKGQLCIFDAADLKSVCAPINPAMVKVDAQGNYHVRIITSQSSANQVPAAQMDNWITTDPESWGNMENYINELKNQDKQCLGL